MFKEGVESVGTSRSSNIILIQNWTDELQRLVPIP
jgi:hypothetical protein